METLEFKNIVMQFPGVKALDNVSFRVESGKVISLIGENGAGKSTLLKILYGDYKPTGGEVLFNGKKFDFTCPNDALKSGVSIIYQERQIFKDLTVAENLFMGKQPIDRFGKIDYKRLRQLTQEVIDEFGLSMKPTDKVGLLSVAGQQMVEIMKACNRELKIIAFDEPTASLDEDDTEKLFEIIQKLQKKGVIILYVSHRMPEVFKLCQEAVVFKDGRFVDQVSLSEVDESALIRMMIGRDLGQLFDRLERNEKTGKTILEVRSLCSKKLKSISFELHEGEILGFSGLVGAGRTEVMRVIYGLDHMDSGEILFEGEVYKPSSPMKAIKSGISYCSEDRKQEGIVPMQPVRSNISMSVWKRLCRLGILDGKKERAIAAESVARFRIKTAGLEQKVLNLSGGNQQKTIVARFVLTNPKVLILDEPTKGIDVGAKSEMYAIICELARAGIGIILISSELSEVIGLCDRVLVMRDGKVAGEVARGGMTEEKLLSYAVLE